MIQAAAAQRIRDAARSREAILAVAEELFAERGYGGASLNDIAAGAGLSRGAPSYFFGSKQQLYVQVLNRAFAERQLATADAFDPVHAWCRSPRADLDGLRSALSTAADAYLRFLVDHPTFVRLVMHEELTGGERLRARTVSSTAMQDAFTALRRRGRRRGLRAFAVQDAILVFVALIFSPVSYGHTLMRSVGRDLKGSAGRRHQVRLAVDELMHLITGPAAP